jgi:7-cyano-7-deazaguanine synthase in queuosine biosynthesis
MTVEEIKKLAENAWEGCDEVDKQFWVNGFIHGYLIAENENIVGQSVQVEASKQETWECYEINVVQSRMHGCKSQCKECKAEQFKK